MHTLLQANGTPGLQMLESNVMVRPATSPAGLRRRPGRWTGGTLGCFVKASCPPCLPSSGTKAKLKEGSASVAWGVGPGLGALCTSFF